LFGTGCLTSAVALVASCSVFPDAATLPTLPPSTAGVANAGGVGGGDDPSPAGAPGAGVAGLPDAGGSPPTGGVSGGGSAALPAGAGGVDMASAGAGSEPPLCNDPRQVIVPMAFDTWIESAKPKQSHGSDLDLLVVGAPDERRALLQLMLPAHDDGEALLGAQLTLHLKANSDAGGAARQLGLHRLTREVGSNTTWDNYSSGASRKWTTPGGDFGPELARLSVPAASTEAVLSFDVTELIRSTQSPTPVTLSVVVLEIGSAPAAPADLAFDAVEGDASVSPQLSLSYCAP
jgi:hypothetical protein